MYWSIQSILTDVHAIHVLKPRMVPSIFRCVVMSCVPQWHHPFLCFRLWCTSLEVGLVPEGSDSEGQGYLGELNRMNIDSLFMENGRTLKVTQWPIPNTVLVFQDALCRWCTLLLLAVFRDDLMFWSCTLWTLRSYWHYHGVVAGRVLHCDQLWASWILCFMLCALTQLSYFSYFEMLPCEWLKWYLGQGADVANWVLLLSLTCFTVVNKALVLCDA